MNDAATEDVTTLGLRPLTGIVGRGSEMGRLLGHLDAHRSVRLDAPRGAGATALLRAVCAEPPRPGTPGGTIALPVGLPMDDMRAAVQRLQPDAALPVDERRMLVLLDDRDLTPADVDTLHRTFPSSLLLVTGAADSHDEGLAPVVIHGLSQHHAVGLVEAAMGRPLSIEEGRAARLVATAVAGMPGPLVQAAAAVRDGGLTFTDVLDLLDDPPRPMALSTALQHALDDELHVTLSHVRAISDVPVTTRVAAVAADLDEATAHRRLRRLAVLGLVLTDGRDGWTTAPGVAAVSEPVRAGVAARLTAWMRASDDPMSIFDIAPVLGAVADRVAAGDRSTTVALTNAALTRLPLEGLSATQALLDSAQEWSLPQPRLVDSHPADLVDGPAGAASVAESSWGAAGAAGAAAGAGGLAAADGLAGGSSVDADSLGDVGVDAGAGEGATGATAGPLDTDDVDASTADPRAADTSLRDTNFADPSARDHGSPGDTSRMAPTAAADAASGADGDDTDADRDTAEHNPLVALLSDRRRLLLVAVAAAAVIAAMLLVVPSLRDDDTGTVLRGDVDLGVATVGETTSGTLSFDLSSSTATTPIALGLSGPDADAFTIDPERCDTLDCRASVTFAPQRSGTHVATVTAVDDDGVQQAVAALSASGTGDSPAAPASTDLSVTLFTTEPSPIPAGGQAVLPVGVRNAGPDDSTGAALVVTVPDGVTASAGGCTFSGDALTCPLADIDAGQQQRVEVSLAVPDDAVDVRVGAEVRPVTDTDDATGDNAAGFTYPVAAPEEEN